MESSSVLPPIPVDTSTLWILVVSCIIAFFLAFGVGANDVANSFGTSVGSKVLTLKQACILATIFEILGSIALGYQVSSTIRTGIIHIDKFTDRKELMLGYLAALLGSSIWNLLATLFGLPVSGTHSIVGSVIGFAVVLASWNSVQWTVLIKIVISWFASPLASGLVSLLLYLFIKWFILKPENSLNRGLKALPFFYGFTVFLNIFSIFYDGPSFLKVITWWMTLLGSLILGIVTSIFIWLYLVPKIKAKVLNNDVISLENKNKQNSDPISAKNNEKSSTEQQIDVEKKNNGKLKLKDEKDQNESSNDDDKPEVVELFSFLQIMTACFASFAHGANDVSNAIGPLVAVIMLYQHGIQNDNTPWYILLYGGVSISIGLWVWGRKVIKTMGQDLTKITPSTGFTIELGTAITVLLASKIGLPVSTTHCKVGSVVLVGKATKNQKGVNWKLFVNIAMAWFLTVPISALLSALAMWLLKLIVF